MYPMPLPFRIASPYGTVLPDGSDLTRHYSAACPTCVLLPLHILSVLLRDSGGALTKVILHLVYLQCLSPFGRTDFFPARLSDLELATGLRPRAVGNAVRQLESEGLIRRRRGLGGKPNHYQINWAPPADPAAWPLPSFPLPTDPATGVDILVAVLAPETNRGALAASLMAEHGGDRAVALVKILKEMVDGGRRYDSRMVEHFKIDVRQRMGKVEPI